MPESMILDIVYFQLIRFNNGYVWLIIIQRIGFFSILMNRIKCSRFLSLVIEMNPWFENFQPARDLSDCSKKWAWKISPGSNSFIPERINRVGCGCFVCLKAYRQKRNNQCQQARSDKNHNI